MAQQLSTKQRSLRTGLQSIGALAFGLFTTVWAVDGVPTAVFNYLGTQGAILFGTTGVAGLVIGYLMNRKRS